MESAAVQQMQACLQSSCKVLPPTKDDTEIYIYIYIYTYTYIYTYLLVAKRSSHRDASQEGSIYHSGPQTPNLGSTAPLSLVSLKT